ncbi:MAG: SusC/RagA family TonB-linked outer membrane protein [Candidatus Cryptobacteroides sp.]
MRKIMLVVLSALTAIQLFAQKTVGGRVSGPDGEPLVGVAVIQDGTSNAAVTDFDGRYSLTIQSQDCELVFTCIGYTEVRIAWSGQPTVDVKMQEELTRLDDVVVIGYGKTTKKEVTGSVASLRSDDFTKGSNSSPYDLINGKIAGLSIIRSDGADPNGGISIQLRGTTTMSAGATPLVVIDNVIGGNLESIDPQEIESIDVLKDGSAAAIYGTRGTNGVILITTKKGKKGEKATVDFSTYVGVQKISRKLDMLTADEFRQVMADGHTGFDGGASTDWLDEITKDAPVTQYYNLGVTGGTQKVNYRASVSFNKEDGIILNSDRRDIRGRLNLTQTAINDRLTLNYNFNYSSRVGHPTDQWAIQQAVRRNPTEPVYDPEDTAHGGYYTNNAPFQYYNPVALLNENTAENRNRTMMGSIRATFKITDDLSVSATGSYDEYSGSNSSYKTKYYPQDAQRNGEASINNYWNVQKMLDIEGNYSRTFGDHSLSALVGYSYSDETYETAYMWNKDFDSDYFKWHNIGNGTGLLSGEANMSSSKQSSRLIAFFGRVMYNYKEKYLLSASARYEGSSRFGANHKWGMFPAVSLGWRIDQEDFMKDVRWVDELKIRAGYGVTGNQEISNYQSLALLQASGKFYYNGQWLNSYGPASNKNDDLKWEKKSEFNVGVDFSVLKGRLSGTVDYYNRTTSDLLYTYSVPVPPNLYSRKFTNVGTIKNSGIELTLTGVPFNKKDFGWNTTLTIAHNENKLKSFSNDDYAMQYIDVGYISTDFKQYIGRIYEGEPIGNFYGPVFLGMDENGNAMYKGVEPGQAVSEDVYEVIGNAYPDVTLGWNNAFRYKNWDLSFLFRASIGNDVANVNRLFYEGYYYFGGKNILKSTLDSKDNTGQTTWSSHFVEDGSFLKLSNVTLSYTWKPKFSWMESLKAYVTGQNLLTITGYKGVDPEVSLNGLAPGIAWDEYYPTTRTFVLGVNITF